MSGFFEEEGPDGKAVLHEPTAAHHAVARLVANGSVRVIVTMNFDHLFEAALREQGIEPYVISTDQTAKDRPPLHTKKCTVVHLHGSYLDANSMLNTDTELGAYQTHMQTLLTEIVQTHGLLIAGWSAAWDKALRETVMQEYRPFYTPAWITPNDLEPKAQEVVEAIGASVLPATADVAFTRLADAVDTLQARSVRHPVTAQVVVDRIKRDLAGEGPAITAHDTLAAELGRLDELPELTSNLLIGDDYDERLATVDEACRVAAAATAVLARWGSD
ncbi:SIR2 family protein, partial [Streptomyces sp. SID10244]|nr:SIR2 family protein [Streptomyces sp. SID10244]